MAYYRLTNRAFSRTWRRSKNYRKHEIRWLARRRGLTVKDGKQGAIQVVDKNGSTVANFEEVRQNEIRPVSERLRAFATLRLQGT